MEHFDRKKHWETIYQTKALNEVSWYEPTPETSLDFIKQFNLPTTAKIIDIGGGDSKLVEKQLMMFGTIELHFISLLLLSKLNNM